MKISPSIVRVKKIAPSQDWIEFSETQLDEAARLILEIEGVVTPLILLRTAPESESYRVIDGHFEYFAAIRAMEIDSRIGNTINAYIIEDEKDVAVYQKQVEVFRQRKSLPQQSPSQSVPSEASNLEARFAALENMLHNISDQIKALQPAPPKTEKTLLEDINTLPIKKLIFKLEQIKTRKNVRENILKARQNPSFQPFQSRHELIERIAGLRQKTFDTMLDKFIKL